MIKYNSHHFAEIWLYKMQVFAITFLLAMQSLRSKLLAGGKSYGPIVLSGSPTVAEILAFVG